ncbi:MaoC family dehydratase N-terminal domain-containing protein [Dactylosporangium sp. NPDC049742]|uniref:FAS1-like dehydratase domain-containing protein n=1 Tax=Dactylosporangium sp. NPDC049742 TaxID=3154737 RepID=UPI003441CE56
MSSQSSASGRLTDQDPVAAGAPFRFVVEEGKVHEFARATRSRCAEHLRPEDPLAPLTFLTASQLWMAPEHSAWHGVERDFRSVLHGEQEYVFHAGPLRAGDVLTARQFIERTYDKQGRRGGTMRFTDVVTRFWRTGEAEPVADMRTVTITVESTAGPAAAAPVAAPAAGDEPPLTLTDFVRYQGASGDFNPIHHDPGFARAAGYPGPFAVGMLAAGVAANRIAELAGTAAVRRLRIRFQSTAWPGDVLSYAISEDGPTLSATVKRPDGSVHLTVVAEREGS